MIQEISDELREFGAVVRPMFCALCHVGGRDISQLDLKDAVVSEIFCKNRLTSRA